MGGRYDGGWSHWICSQKAERGTFWCKLDCFLPLFNPGWLPTGCYIHSGMVFPAHLNLSGSTPDTGRPKRDPINTGVS